MNIIFDIDGTLVQSYDFDGDCYADALRAVLGPVRLHADWGQYRHVTDAGILAQVCAENGVAAEVAEQAQTRFTAMMLDRLAAEPCACPPVPGAVAMMAALVAQPDVQVGLASGGWKDVARAKLTRAGLPFEAAALFGSDVALERTEIMRACHLAISAPEAPTVYVGDAEWDVTATAELGWHFVGIGNRLRGKCRYWIADFRGPEFARCLAAIPGGAPTS